MPYTTQAEIEAEIPALFLRRALDDDGDGSADDGVLDQVIANAGRAVDAALEGLYTVPLDPVPAVAREAAFIFTCEAIYNRRRQHNDERNPYTDRANTLRTKLERIGKGELPLTLDNTDAPAAAWGSRDSVPGRI